MKRLTAVLMLFLGLWLTGASGQQAPADVPSVDGELIVKFRSGAPQGRRAAALAIRGARLLRSYGALDLHRVRIAQGQGIQAAVAALQADPDVEFAQPNYIRHTTQSATPNDPYWLNDSLWGLKQIHADSEWSAYSSGNGSVVVASIDTGVNYLHPDLAANMWTNPGEIPANGIDDDHNGYVDDIHGINAITGSGDPMDDHGHGTHTAGTIAGVGNNGQGVVGVNWNAKIIGCKFISVNNSGWDSDAIECLNYLVGLKARGVNIRASNNSWGGPRGAFPQALKTAFDAAGAAGILNVCAAGNGSSNNSVAPFDPASLTSSSIVSVAASDHSDGRASFSNYGSSVHLAAPGVDILSTYGMNYGVLNGTSMAAPHVAGAALLVAQRNPSLSPEGIKAVLMSSVDVLPQWSGVVASGGRLNLFSAATAATASQTLLTTQVPAAPSYDGGAAWELGTRFVSDVAGQVTAVRFWKSPSDNGSAHVGHVWTAGGQLLTSVTFTNETASGWQQQALGAPLTVAANAPYVVSVNTGPNGRWAGTLGFFLTPLVNGHLTGPTGANGVYSQPNAMGTFPMQTDQGVNFFRDVVFLPTSGPPDTTPPTVSVTQPAPGSQVSGAVTVAASAQDDVGVTGVQFQVDGTNVGGEVLTAPYSVVWNSTGASNGSHVLTAIARDAAGHSTSASVTVTVSNAGQVSQTLLTTQVPGTLSYNGGGTWELGTRFVSDVAGQITAVRFWKSPSDNGSTHVGHVWTAAGQPLASVTFTNETASGWQQQALSTPLSIAANAGYVVSVNTGPNGLWAGTFGFFLTPLVNGHLTGPAGANGLYSQPNAMGTFPMQTDQGVNFFRDIVFVPAGGPPDTTAPTVSVTQPVHGSQVSGAVTVAASAQDDVGVTGVQFQVDGGNFGGEVSTAPYSVVWNSTGASNGSHVLTAIARDAAGHSTSASVTVTVSNAGQVSQTLLTTQVPGTLSYNGGGTWELGTRFVSDVAGQITAVRFWKSPSDNGSTHVGHVWTAAGQPLASVTFTNETASGWQQQALSTPLSIAANAGYVVSVNTGPNGLWAGTFGFFLTPLVNGHLTGPAGANGLYSQPNAMGTFPMQTDQGVNFFRDIVFVPTGGVSPPLAPAPVQTSNLTVRLDLVGQIPTHQNPTSAVVAGSQLLLVNQAGYVYRWDGTAHDLLTPADFPAGIFPPGGESVLNVAANAAGSSVFVMFSTFTAPVAIPVSVSPRPSDSWQVLYQYDFNGLSLSNPRAIRAFQVRSDGHTGGGLVVLNDGTVVCAIGDNGDSGEDGRSYAQDPTNHLAKILRINPMNGSTTVLALGVRNVQRLVIDPNGGDPRLVFADLGGFIAEEINSVRLADLLGAPSPLNFGWGRHAGDGNAREGTFYIDGGGAAVGAAPSPESGFVQPIGQFGREGAAAIAVSGPVSGSPSFSTIRTLFGDLPSGSVYALTGPLSQAGQPVFAVNLVDSNLQSITLTGLAGGRPDPRFFMFPDGSAGVLLERTGAFYRLTEVPGMGHSSRTR